jgi:uncharacterized spore protein YtfJ
MAEGCGQECKEELMETNTDITDVESQFPSRQGATQAPHPVSAHAEPPGEALQRASHGMTAMIERLITVARGESAVATPAVTENRVMLPLASVQVSAVWGVGFGSGAGDNSATKESAAMSGVGSGGGAGGGGRSNARIIAVAEVSDTGVKVLPVVDRTALGLGFMALVAIGFLSRRGALHAVGARLLGSLETAV